MTGTACPHVARSGPLDGGRDARLLLLQFHVAVAAHDDFERIVKWVCRWTSFTFAAFAGTCTVICGCLSKTPPEVQCYETFLCGRSLLMTTVSINLTQAGATSNEGGPQSIGGGPPI